MKTWNQYLNERVCEGIRGNVPTSAVVPGVVLTLVRRPIYGDTAPGGGAEQRTLKQVASVEPASRADALLLTFKGVKHPGRSTLRTFSGVVVGGMLVSVYTIGPRSSKFDVIGFK